MTNKRKPPKHRRNEASPIIPKWAVALILTMTILTLLYACGEGTMVV